MWPKSWRHLLWWTISFLAFCQWNACAAFVNEQDVAIHNLTRSTESTVFGKHNRVSQKIAKSIAAYLGTRIALNIAFRNEKRLAGVDAAKKLFSLLPHKEGISSKPYVLTFLDAQDRLYDGGEFHPGYYVITDVPMISSRNGNLDQQMFPHSQELFPNMCGLMTCWQSFTVGQSIQTTRLGTPDFCHGQLIWYIGTNYQPHPIALDEHDRRSIFHSWYWMKQIIQIDKYRPGITTAVLLLIKGILAFRSPSLLPLLLLDQNLVETIGQRIKSITTLEKESASRNATIVGKEKDIMY